jgi:diadenosine tetraphosphatase ApaH/serine/threonine PP2A family protein phosphatase
VRYAVIGDIHSNLQALRAVLDDIERVGADAILCVGDLVGYGADPSECVRLLKEREAVVVAGNHDWAVVEKIDVGYFNADARDSIEWTRQQLSEEELAYIHRLDLVEVVDEITVVHSSPFSPEYFDYIQTRYDVELAFSHLETPLCFIGHSHVPIFLVDDDPPDYFLEPEFRLPPDKDVIVNVGSVGQPRDLDPRSCYVLYDAEEKMLQIRRLDYDLHTASESMTAAGLPPTNAARIVLGR